MIRYTTDGQPPQQGINIYPSSDPYSRGFVLRVWYAVLSVRYSKVINRWRVRAYWLGSRV